MVYLLYHILLGSKTYIGYDESGRVRCVGHVARIWEMSNVYIISVGKPEGKRTIGRPARRWGIVLDWIIKKEVGRLFIGFIWLLWTRY
jgi:hypothetical protein